MKNKQKKVKKAKKVKAKYGSPNPDFVRECIKIQKALMTDHCNIKSF